MKRTFLDRLLNDWVYPLAIIAIVVWLVIRVFGLGAEPEVVEPEPTEEPVIVQNYGNLHLFGKDA